MPELAPARPLRQEPNRIGGSRLRRVLALAAVNVALLAIVVSVLELTFGTWFVPYTPPHGAIVSRTFMFRQTVYQPASLVTYVRDRYGLRGARVPIDRIELVALGGSTTDQRLVTEGKTWTEVLEAMSGLRVANAGVNGMSLAGHLYSVEDWLHRIPDFHPRYYLHYVGVNDAALTRPVPPRSSLSRTIKSRSAIITSLSRLNAWLSPLPIVADARATLAEATPKEIKVAVDRAPIRAFVEGNYKANLRQLLALHRGRNEQVILVSQPGHPALVRRSGDDVFVRLKGIEKWAVAIFMVNAATGAVCAEQPDICHFVDLAGKLEFESDDFYDLVHNTPAGTRRIGGFLAGELTALGIVPARAVGR